MKRHQVTIPKILLYRTNNVIGKSCLRITLCTRPLINHPVRRLQGESQVTKLIKFSLPGLSHFSQHVVHSNLKSCFWYMLTQSDERQLIHNQRISNP